MPEIQDDGHTRWWSHPFLKFDKEYHKDEREKVQNVREYEPKKNYKMECSKREHGQYIHCICFDGGTLSLKKFAKLKLVSCGLQKCQI